MQSTIRDVSEFTLDTVPSPVVIAERVVFGLRPQD